VAFFYSNLLTELSKDTNRIFILNGKTQDNFIMPDYRYLSLELVLLQFFKKDLCFKSVAFIDSDGLFFWDYDSELNLMGLPEKKQKQRQDDLGSMVMKRPNNITTRKSSDNQNSPSFSTDKRRLRYDFSGSSERLLTKVRSMLQPRSDDLKEVAGDTAVIVLEKGFLLNMCRENKVMVNFSGFLKDQFCRYEDGVRNKLIFVENSEDEEKLSDAYREKGLQDLFSYSLEDRKLLGAAKYIRILPAGKKECEVLLAKLRIIDQKDIDIEQKETIATMLACWLRENNRDMFQLYADLHKSKEQINFSKLKGVINQTMEKSAQQQMDEMIGMKNLKQEIKEEIEGYPATDQESADHFMQYPERLAGEVGGGSVCHNLNHYVLVGNPGTGKSKVAKIIAKLLQEKGLLPTGQLIKASASDLIAEHVGGTAVKTRTMIEKALGGVLFIDEAYAIKENDQFGKQCLATLVDATTDLRGRFVLIMAGYKNEMNELIKENPGMLSRVKVFELPDYNEEELSQIMALLIKEYNYDPEVVEKAQTYVSNLMQNRAIDEKWGNAREIETIVNKALVKSRIRNKGQVYLSIDDFSDPEYFSDHFKPKAITLDSLIGLKELKKKVEKLVARAKYHREKDKSYTPGHFMFLGNPGTGKTEVAKILANEFYRLGILESPKTVFKSAGDFIKGYIGHSEENVTKVFNSALGGVLVIDEAHQLAEEHSYGPQVLKTLNPLMENQRHNIVVILAGYSKSMKKLFDVEPGLNDRIKQKLDFQDYNAAELFEIFEVMWEAEYPDIKVTLEFKPIIIAHFEEIKRLDGAIFGNARYVRNFRDRLFENYIYRVQNNNSSQGPIMKEDLEAAMEEGLNERK
jgi:replication-associated recombination protein RarA